MGILHTTVPYISCTCTCPHALALEYTCVRTRRLCSVTCNIISFLQSRKRDKKIAFFKYFDTGNILKNILCYALPWVLHTTVPYFSCTCTSPHCPLALEYTCIRTRRLYSVTCNIISFLRSRKRYKKIAFLKNFDTGYIILDNHCNTLPHLILVFHEYRRSSNRII